MATGDFEEPFLTVAEVAEILRLNPQTVRNWIDAGTLPAIRVGRRVRIKRVDLDRILEDGYRGTSGVAPPGSGPDAHDFWGGEPVGAVEAVAQPANQCRRRQLMSFGDDLERERDRVMRLVRHASVGWAEAMRAHKLAPPDDGFSARLQKLSEAATAEQIALQQAHTAGVSWRPVPGADRAEPPYELRQGSGRRGPEDLWLHFDGAVSELNRAIAGSSAQQVSKAFGTMAEASAELAAAVAEEDEIKREAREMARARNAA